MKKRSSTMRKSRSRKSLTVHEAGRKGGMTTAQRYGHDFYQMIGSKGGSTTADKYGDNHFEEIGRKGGKAPHEVRGLQAADTKTREEVARKGGKARSSGILKKVKRLVHLN